MQRALILLILLIVGIGIYLFNQKSDSLTNSAAQTGLEPKAIEIQPSVVKAAKDHIEKLTSEAKEQVLDITQADNFVTGEQLLKMPTMESESIAIEAVDRVESAAADAAPFSQPQTQSAQSGDARSSQPTGTTESNTQAVPSPELTLPQPEVTTTEPESGNRLVVTQALDTASKVIQGSVSALQGQSVVVTQGAAPAVSFESSQVTQSNLEVSDALQGKSLRPGQRIRLQELLSDPDLAAGTVFYIHAVSPTDEQGLWGILQRGLIKTFAQGMELKESGRVLTVEIPLLADETLENRRSSFLGEFLYQKVQDTYVYNYQQGMLGQDPDLIKPGQQLIIVSYSEAELISIFNHFTQPGA